MLKPCANVASSALRDLVSPALVALSRPSRSSRSSSGHSSRKTRSQTVIVPSRRVLRSEQSGCPAVRLAYDKKGLEVESNTGFASKTIKLVDENSQSVSNSKKKVNKTKVHISCSIFLITLQTSSVQQEVVPELTPASPREIPTSDVMVDSPVQGTRSEIPASLPSPSIPVALPTIPTPVLFPTPTPLTLLPFANLSPTSLLCGLRNVGNSVSYIPFPCWSFSVTWTRLFKHLPEFLRSLSKFSSQPTLQPSWWVHSSGSLKKWAGAQTKTVSYQQPCSMSSNGS